MTIIQTDPPTSFAEQHKSNWYGLVSFGLYLKIFGFLKYNQHDVYRLLSPASQISVLYIIFVSYTYLLAQHVKNLPYQPPWWADVANKHLLYLLV